MRRRTILLVSAVIVGAATLSSCSRGDGESGQPARAPGSDEAAGRTVFAVNVTPAVEGSISDYIEVNGDVQATSTVDVFADTAGEIAALSVRVGDTVTAGQRIADIDPSRPGQTFALSPVRAPIDGTVTRLTAERGAQVSPAAPIAQISRTDDLEISVSIAERFVSRVAVGQQAEVALDAAPGRVFPAVVSELSPVVDPLTRTLGVTLRFVRRDSLIRAGMFADVRLITEQKDRVVTVPAEVMIRRFGETFVFVVPDTDSDSASARRRIVVPGIEIDNKLEIVEGLSANELVVYQGQNLLEDGSLVRVIDTIRPFGDSDQ